MGLNTNLEKNFGWLAFPGLIRIVAMLQCVVFALLIIKPEAYDFFIITDEGLSKGQYWRLISWIFFPIVYPTPGALSLINVLFMVITVRIAFLFSDSIEHAWGEVRTSCYLYGTFICQTAIYWVFRDSFPLLGGNMLLYYSLFFVFATLYPNFEFALMMILPIKVWILALLSLLILISSAIKFPLLFIVYGISFLPYLIWVIPRLFGWTKGRRKLAARQVKFQSLSKQANSQTLHECVVCKRTEKSDPDLEFRVAEDGEEYCLDHLPR